LQIELTHAAQLKLDAIYNLDFAIFNLDPNRNEILVVDDYNKH